MSNVTTLLSTTEAAAYLGVKRQRILQLAAEGRIGRRIGSAWAFTRTELDAYRTQRRIGRPRLLASSMPHAGDTHIAQPEDSAMVGQATSSRAPDEFIAG